MGYIVAIAIYLAAIMVYGLVLAHKKVKTTDDMMTGGHRIPFIIHEEKRRRSSPDNR
jgi:SSS family solute:Na+ symporter